MLMNTFFRLLCTVLAMFCVCCLPGPSLAMSYAEYLSLKHSSAAFKAADRELNLIWAQARKQLGCVTFRHLRDEQRLWLKQRDSLARELMANLPKDQAYARITRDRAAHIAHFLQAENPAPEASLSENRSSWTQMSLAEMKPLLHKALLWKKGASAQTTQGASSNQSAAKASSNICDSFSISNRLYYGHYVPRPFVTFNLNVRKARRISSLMVNNYEIRRIKRYSKDLPQWKRRNDRNVELNLFTDTILDNIAIVYNDGTICRIDNINIQKDMTNPYN